ncbi:protein kinase [Leptospira sp. 201903071]|uniref:protein kinase domain-containing protein n=1 Tax=Leptospira ainazelensis TaxID=2810034 RepID=UPI0019636F0F|nr:protein kinase [Leptospira ainazelensis]MBM9500287.1 protein kinase [Leptospira ainazelensis]
MKPERFPQISNAIAKKENLVIESFVGNGSFKDVYKCKKDDKSFVALKIADPTATHPERESREIESMLKCNISQIGKLYKFDSYIDLSSGKSYHYLIEEYFQGGDLKRKLESHSLAKTEIGQIGLQLSVAIKELKSLNLVHRDIKPENIMFRSSDNCNAALTDFGLVRDLSEDSLTGTWLVQGPGTPLFASPEQLNNDKSMIDWRSDQFSVALTLSYCLLGFHPFQIDSGNTMQAIINVCERKAMPVENIEKLNEFGFGCLVKMLSPWPIHRIASPDKLVELFTGLTV